MSQGTWCTRTGYLQRCKSLEIDLIAWLLFIMILKKVESNSSVFWGKEDLKTRIC